MALSPSPRPSPALRNAGKVDRALSPSPPPQPLSKRDKRRSALSDRYNDIHESFSRDRDIHYRQQLQAIQIDMGLITKAKPYADYPLDDSAEAIDELVAAAMNGSSSTAGMNGTGVKQSAAPFRYDSDIAAMAGKAYAVFVEEVNDIIEERDAQLSLLQREHERTMHEFHKTNHYKIALAQEEHRQLKNTLRERLIQSVQSKKQRLLREKEQLDVADSNALLLHPNQFSITNPASPAGMQGNRKTRHARLREVDELVGTFSADGSHKRKKRVNAYDDNDLGSPGPAGRPLDAGLMTPFKATQAKLLASQHEAPLYTIDKLFTEKELAMHLNAAAVATSRYFESLKAQEADVATNGLNPTNGGSKSNLSNGVNANDDPSTSAAAAYPDNPTNGSVSPNEEDAALATPADMDRTANHSSHHATRSTRALGGHLGDINDKLSGPTTILPPFLPLTYLNPITSDKKNGSITAPPLASLRAEDADEDLAIMEKLKIAGPSVVDNRVLNDLCAPIGTSTFPPISAVVMSKQSSSSSGGNGTAGVSSETGGAVSSLRGGTPMKRDGEGSSMGGTGGAAAMKRTASGAGLTVPGANGPEPSGKRPRR